MDIEIELKLLASESAGQDIKNWLAVEYSNAVIMAPVDLANFYYDTPDRQLRRADMGLRIRGCNQVFEQTIKTRGSSVGGLHQRPEYNVPLVKPVLDLRGFESGIWPKNLDVEHLQNSLEVLFTTEFNRQIFVLTLNGGSVVEIVFDQGWITTGTANNQTRVPICEVELELKQGRPRALFSLAKQICLITAVRFGNLSKAARGYYLVDGTPQKALCPIKLLPVTLDYNIEQSFSLILEYGLNLWQTATADFFISQDLADLELMLSAIKLLHYTIEVYQPWLSPQVLQPINRQLKTSIDQWQWLEKALAYASLSKPTSLFSKMLTSEQLYYVKSAAKNSPQLQHAQVQVKHPQELQLQLDISLLLVDKAWRDDLFIYQQPLRNVIDERIQDYVPVKDASVSGQNIPWHEQLDHLNRRLTLQLIWGNTRSGNSQLPLNWWQRFAGTDELAQLSLVYTTLSECSDEDGVALQACTSCFLQQLQYSKQALNQLLLAGPREG
ncbi:MAG: inorganic triphosphatase YgiF [Paraglaciecola sp.]|jgi:inorganic triphosphatase YgiF